MRTLTLGVLIVAGGTMAALPFRRYQAIPDASSAPAQVTGPTQSILQSSSAANIASDAAAVSPSIDLAYGSAMPALGEQLQPTAAARQHQRRADIPLTYEDLEMPIDLPDPVKHRFNATASVRAEQLQRERSIGIVMPDVSALDRSQLDQIESAANQFAAGVRERTSVSGSLASARRDDLERLPQASPQSDDRPRHWIRQPD